MDVFISYRRDTGYQLAKVVESYFDKKGIVSFFDKNSIHNEDFMDRVRRGIDSAPNFVMILTPGYLVKREGTEDYVREEILYALKKKKNILAIASVNYNHDEVKWDDEIPEIAQLRFFSYDVFQPVSKKMETAFFDGVFENMKNPDGSRFSFKKKLIVNSWYSNHEMSEEDLLWIKTDHDVCKRMDWRMLEKIVTEEEIFAGRESLKLFVYKAYDIETYADKYKIRSENHSDSLPEIEVYGVTHESLLKEADQLFGTGHFVSDKSEESYYTKIRNIMEERKLDYFDMIDLTLVLKDLSEPERTLRKLTQFLNPDGGVILIRELDDDYVDAFPDEREMVKKLKELLELDDGAGNRHTGKKIYTYLQRAGADKVYISDEIVSTANHRPPFRLRMCQSYFSYLMPELRALAENTEENRNRPEYQKYVDGYNWLKEYYDDFESQFCSPDFYFRAGYVTGYGVFTKDKELD